MHCQAIRVFKAVPSRNYGRALASVASRRALSTSPICLDAASAPNAEPERPKGVPLAYEHGGVSIEKKGKRQPLSQKLAARSGAKVDAPTSASAVVPEPRVRKPRPLARRPQDSRGERGRSRSPPRIQQSPRSQAASRTGQGKRPPTQAHSRQKPGQQPGSGQERRSGQARAGAASRGPRTGQQRDGGGRNRTSGPSARRARPNEGEVSAPRGPARSSDPELNDYPNEIRNPPPVRKYDDNGVLVLKGPHEQISPVVPPTVPHLPTSSVNASTSTSSNTLRVLSYLDRAPPVPVTHSSVVEDASRALSRVRELNMPRRRDALSIVERMAKTAGEPDKGTTANT